MRVGSRFLLIFAFGFLLAARGATAASDLKATLAKLDAAAARFKSTTADFEFDSVQTDPIPDTEVQKGTAYYQRKGNTFAMAAHIGEVNGKKTPKVYVYSAGKLKLYEP